MPIPKKKNQSRLDKVLMNVKTKDRKIIREEIKKMMRNRTNDT